MELSLEQISAGWTLDEAVGPDTKLRQGDLVSFEREKNALQRDGIIVTADCDLEQNKHARLVTMVPVVTVQVVLERYLLIEDCERKRDLIESFVFNHYGIDKSQDRATKLSLLLEIVRSDSTSVDRVDLVAAGFALDTLSAVSIDSYKGLMVAIGSAPRKGVTLRDQVRGRGDLFVLPDTRGLGTAGEVAWLRHLWQVPLSDIAIRTSEIASRPGERKARLDSPYRYRLTQLMAQVFSDIGLPDSCDEIDNSIRGIYGNG